MRRTVIVIVLAFAAVVATSGLTQGQQVGPQPVSVAALGDVAATSRSSEVLNLIPTLGTAATFVVGDLSYGPTGQEQAWCDFVTARVGAGYPFELLAGNHEMNGQNGHINDFSACLPNQLPGLIGTYGRQYFVDVPRNAPSVRFVMISPNLAYPDGTWSYAKGTARYQWTANAIDGARAAGIPWVVVGMHYPCLSMGGYGCAAGADITHLMVDKRVDIVLNGHEHGYQRTKQLAHGPGCAAVPIGVFASDCVVDADDTLTAGAGTVFATIGTGGVSLRDINVSDPEAPYFRAWSGANIEPTHGLLQLSATADALAAQFRAAGTGTFRDSFTITRVDAPPDTSAPTAPGTPSATVSGSTVTLAWPAASDDVGVTGYRVYRGSSATFTVGQGELRGSVGGGTRTFDDQAVPAGTHYYRVLAVDGAGNAGPLSEAVAADVAAVNPDQVVTVASVADTWVNSTATTATAGSSWVFRAKGGSSPQVPYLRFVLPTPPPGTSLAGARLQLRTSSNSWSGSGAQYDIRLVSDNAWQEGTMTWTNRPAVSGTVLGSVPGGTSVVQTVEVPLTVQQLPGAGGAVSMALTSDSTDNVEMQTKESPSGKPTLVLTYR
jgi:hypothetical protein